MERLGPPARRFLLDILIVVVAVESTAEVALGRHSHVSVWFAGPAIALVVLPLLARRRFPFYAPAVVWLLAATASSVDGWLVVMPASAVIAGMTAAFLLGNLSDGLQARLGLAIVTCGAVIITDNNPSHPRDALIFTPLLFAIVWGAGFAQQQRVLHA
jgi:hypothetical protein